MNFFYPNAMYGGRMTRFESQYSTYSMALLGRQNIEDGDKIILPPSALDVIAQLNVEYPLLFELSKGHFDWDYYFIILVMIICEY